MSDERLLTAAEVGEHFSLDERQVMEAARKFNWPRIQIGRKFRWTPELLEQIERTHTVTPDGVAPADGRTARSAGRRSA